MVGRALVFWIPRAVLKSSTQTRFAAVAVLSVAMSFDAMARMPRPEFGPIPPGWEAAGKWIKERSQPGDWLATCAAGILPYASGLPAIDMLGLSDLHIAHLTPEGIGSGVAGHEKVDPFYVLSRKPRFISTWLGGQGNAGRGLGGVFEFRAYYRLAAVVGPGREGEALLIDLDPATPIAEILELQKNGYNWGIWVRGEEGPREELMHYELKSQLVDPIPPSDDGVLLNAPKGHQQTHVLYGPYMGFVPGAYRWELDLELLEDDFSGELCRFEANRNLSDHTRVMIQNEPVLGEELRGGVRTVFAEFEVSSEDSKNNFSMGLFCHGLTGLKIHSLRVVRI